MIACNAVDRCARSPRTSIVLVEIRAVCENRALPVRRNVSWSVLSRCGGDAQPLRRALATRLDARAQGPAVHPLTAGAGAVRNAMPIPMPPAQL